MSLGGGQNTEGTNAGGIYVQFNQDCTSLVAGSSSGYHLFALTADDGVEEIYASRTGQDTCLVERLFSSSLVAIVTVSAPRKLIVCHYKKGTEICNYSYSNTILAVKLNRSRLIVCLEESLHIHNIRDMKILHTIRDTPPNPRGLCALSPCVDHCYVAYPGSSAVGEVQIFDAVHLNAKCVLSAHDAPLAALAWSMCGRRLATASERGTVIRVFSVPQRVKLHEFRRGVKRCVSISCLSFSACGTYLAATSNTETVHVFRAQDAPAATPAAPAPAPAAAAPAPPDDAPAEEPTTPAAAASSGWMGWLSSAVTAGAGYLPATVADVLAQGRACAAARLPAPPRQAQAAVTVSRAGPSRLLVATSQGVLYVYALPAPDGGECALLRTHRLLDAIQQDSARELVVNGWSDLSRRGVLGYVLSVWLLCSAGRRRTQLRGRALRPRAHRRRRVPRARPGRRAGGLAAARRFRPARPATLPAHAARDHARRPLNTVFPMAWLHHTAHFKFNSKTRTVLEWCEICNDP